MHELQIWVCSVWHLPWNDFVTLLFRHSKSMGQVQSALSRWRPLWECERRCMLLACIYKPTGFNGNTGHFRIVEQLLSHSAKNLCEVDGKTKILVLRGGLSSLEGGLHGAQGTGDIDITCRFILMYRRYCGACCTQVKNKNMNKHEYTKGCSISGPYMTFRGARDDSDPQRFFK